MKYKTLTCIVKVFTTIDKGLRDKLRDLSKELGFKSEADCIREVIRLGTQDLTSQQKSSSLSKKRERDSILTTGGLLSEEYDCMKLNELELKMRSRWKFGTK